MNILIYIFPLLIMPFSNGDTNVNTIHEKLWSKIESQLVDLTKKQELQKTRINGLKGLLRNEGINYTHIPELNDENDNDPFNFAVIGNIKNDFELLKMFHTETKTFNIAQEDKMEIKESVSQNFNNSCGALTSIKSRFESLQSTLETNFNKWQDAHQNLIKTGHSANNEHCTPNQAIYKIFPIDGTEFRFKIRASSNGHVALLPGPTDGNPIYEVVLGGWSNTHSSIRKDRNQDVVKKQYEGLMNPCEFVGFWVRWNGGEIKVGYEGKPTPFLAYKVSNLYKVNYVGIHSYQQAANWIIN